MLKMLPWIILLANLNNLIIGKLWDISGFRYDWGLSWIAVEIGILGGVFLGLFFAGESDVVVSVVSGITYGSLAGSLFSCMWLFPHGNAFLAAGFGILFGSVFGILSDYADDDDDTPTGLGESLYMGIGLGMVLGFFAGISSAALAGLSLIFDGDLKFVLNEFWQSFVACGITATVVFYLVHFRPLIYPVEILSALFAYLRPKDSIQGSMRAWRLHPISWNEASKLPLPFARSMLTQVARQDRNEGLKQIALIASERRFQRRVASRVLEAMTLDDLEVDTIKEIANLSEKLSWVKDKPSKICEFLVSVLPRFDEASQQTARYLGQNNNLLQVKDLHDAISTLQKLQIDMAASRKKLATKLASITKRWRDILAIEERQFAEKMNAVMSSRNHLA